LVSVMGTSGKDSRPPVRATWATGGIPHNLA
jgi:hypothetical protein